MTKSAKKGVSRRAKLAMVAVAVIISIVAFVVMTLGYLGRFEEALVDESASYLAEITEHITVNVATNIRNTQLALETVGLTVSGMKQDNQNKTYLNNLREKYNFEYVGIALSDGFLHSSMESEEKDISEEGYFQKSLQGESVLEYIPIKIFQNSVASGLLISVPVYNLSVDKVKPMGVLVAMLDMKTFEKSVYISSFSGQGHTYVVNANGDILMQTKQLDYGNLLTVLGNNVFAKGYSQGQVAADLKENKTGFAIFSDFKVDKYMHYGHLGIADWSVVSVIEKGLITAKTTRLTQELLMLGIVIVILIPFLLILALSSVLASRANNRASQTKSAFLANMSHEIRTPMNAIVGIGEILLREDMADEHKNHIMGIVNAGNSLLTIINDILDFSKIESGKFNIVEEEYELESLIYDIVAVIAMRLSDKPVQFLVDIDPSLPKYLVGDMIRVKQVLINIIGNAAKFTNSGYVKLGIYGEADGDKLMLTMPIKDTGVGIMKADLDKLFESFSQVDTHRNRSVEGTGLGLAISRQLCKMMGGDITVESTYGEGSTFTVSALQQLTRPDKMIEPPKRKDFNLLVLEASEIMRDHFAVCMDRLHLTYHFCENFEDFAKEVQSNTYTHVLANRAGLHRLAEESTNLPSVIPIALLTLSEQSSMQDYGHSIISPLFALQLSAILSNKQVQSVLLQRGGIDLLSIQPLPFVRALLVDDNEVNLQVATGLMRPYYMQLDCVLSGKSALMAIESHDYDLVFMDHMMPEMDGVEALRLIRSLNCAKKNVPIIALTANVTRGAQDLFLQAGFNDFLSKPIDTVRLNALLNKWLKDLNESREKENPTKAKEFYNKLSQSGHSGSSKNQAKQVGNAKYVNFDAGVASLGSEEVYISILSTYSRSAHERLRMLPLLLDTDLKTFTIEAHGLKGSSGGIHATVMADAAAKLEQMAKAGKVQEIRQYLPEVLSILQETLEEIDRFIAINGHLEEVVPAEEKSVKTEPFSADELATFKDSFWNFDSDKIKDLLSEYNKFCYGAREERLLVALKTSLEAYDFETPISLLEEYEKNTQKGECAELC